MGRAVDTYTLPLSTDQAGEKGACGALAVGTGDRDHQGRGPAQTEPARHLARALQPHVDGRGVQLFEVGEPLAQATFGHAVAGRETGDGRFISCANRRARRGRSSLRGMIISMAPCSSRNSLRWKPSGSFSRTVCSITRGPAKPISAFGSATITSPTMARLAETPP